ncbi:RpiB/LacA/LacB family sugar-phosphate isomerase [Enterococcus sp. BWM-S5]|uniref:RpiB/LacA/LacB family sugar-phosphate isomerase n=1 Tax=Enterococcus larvae TaxID=2794352 RepID=A0ABS4CHF6_9ENTE|nr:RpiB/LacA/LacB family sugar-phosphate isomerase [Enterococcus larvae]MBP1045992.1 RpiB/LacA/LacB family sugar-phosphate isomerase [Enterococcus larvae]
MRIGIGNDHSGYYLKKTISYYLKERMYDYIDLGTKNGFEAVEYSNCVESICQRIQQKEIDRGILIGGTGIGMCILANKHQNIRAVLVQDVFSAKAAREKYDANVLCLGEQICGEGKALLLLETWLQAEVQKDRDGWRSSIYQFEQPKQPQFFS